MAKKRILFFINTLACGGAEKVLVDLVNSIDNLYDVSVISVLGGEYENDLSENITYRKIVKTNNRFLQRVLSGIVFKLPYHIFNLLFFKKHYDLEVAYLGGFCTRVIANRKSKSKKIAFVHTDVSISDKYKRLYKKESDCISEYKRFDRVCFVSNVAKNGFEKTYGPLENAVIIHNIINAKEIQKKAFEENHAEFSTTGLKLISVGRLAYEKGYERLINVIGKIESEHDLELWIIGDGPLREQLKEQISQNGVKSVKLLGYQSNPYSYMKKADIFVCSSLFEGYSTVVTEAVVLGLPVITTDCAGMDEILENGKYGIITENSEEGLKNGLLTLISNSDAFEEQKKISLLHSEEYSNEYAIKEYDELFKEILL